MCGAFFNHMGDPVFFSTAAELRAWLAQQHDQADELWLGYYKKGSGIPSITWPESVDEALCFGWIDGIRKSIDEQRYTIRFTPRRPGSIWSAINLKKAEVLLKSGLMEPAGIAAYQNRDEEKSQRYSYERKNAQLPPAYLTQLKTNKAAYAFFQNLAPSYKKASIWWVIKSQKRRNPPSTTGHPDRLL